MVVQIGLKGNETLDELDGILNERSVDNLNVGDLSCRQGASSAWAALNLGRSRGASQEVRGKT